LISTAQERATTCRSGAPTPTGGRSSNMRVNTLSTGRMEKFLMSKEERMLKDKQFGPGRDMVELTKDGRSSILINLVKNQLQDLIKSSVSTSADHSI